MKPRLMVAPLTGEDCIAWRMARVRWIRRTGGTGAGLRFESAESDRRDADLMWKLSTYTKTGHPPVVHIVLRVDPDFYWPDLLPLGVMYELSSHETLPVS